MRGITGDSSPTGSGALGLPPGVGSELPVPCSSSCVLLTPAPAQLMGRGFFCAGIAAGPPHGPWVVDLWVNGSPNPLCYHKSPLLFSNQTASHTRLFAWTRAQSYTQEKNRLRGDTHCEYLPGHSLRIRPFLTLTPGDNLFSYLRARGFPPPDSRLIGRNPTT